MCAVCRARIPPSSRQYEIHQNANIDDGVRIIPPTVRLAEGRRGSLNMGSFLSAMGKEFINYVTYVFSSGDDGTI